jgi:hypothetical protein
MKTQSMSKMLIVSATLLLSLISCKKEEIVPEKTNQEFYACHVTDDWNEDAIKTHLLGTWNWKHKVCPFNPNDVPTDTEHSGLTAEFKSDNTLTILQDGNPVLTTNWEVIQSETNILSDPAKSYQIKTDVFVSQLLGVLLICEDEVLFTSSYLDGCDNRFEKQ